MNVKSFDCVEMKRHGSERIYARLQKMTLQEELEYWKQRTEALRQIQEYNQKTERVN
jgi:hypothetical protein